MARYHKNLKYHEDTTKKHDITREEIQFLIELQKEMNTQDDVSQADPRYWVIKGTEKEYGIEDGFEDGSDLVDDDGCSTVATDMNEALEFIKEHILDEVNDCDGIQRCLSLEKGLFSSEIRISWVEDGEEDFQDLSNMTSVVEWLKENGYDNYRCANYRILPKIYENTMFLTQKAAEDHLKANYYHYSEDAHTYAMTSWRNRETEALWKLLQSVNWEFLLSTRMEEQ